MRFCLYSPYIPKHTGGGEKYMFDVARVLARKHQVSIAVPAQEMANEPAFRARYEAFLNRSLESISFVPSPLGSASSFLKKWLFTKQFDLMYYATDGSFFFSSARKNIAHIQFPLQLDKSGLVEKMKLANWQVKNTNSEFTKRIVEKTWPVHIDMVHYPQIDITEIKEACEGIQKEKVILSVGRFFRQLHSKRQDVLVEMFISLREQFPTEAKGWKLVLVGGIEDQSYFNDIQKMSADAPIEIYTDLNRVQLLKWYAKARLYWHAAGYDVDEQRHPENVEHFGISTVEAMAAGCVPLVHGKGGQVEIMGEQLTDQLWQTQEECIAKTVAFLSDADAMRTVASQVEQRARVFGPESFQQKLWQMVEGSV